MGQEGTRLSRAVKSFSESRGLKGWGGRCLGETMTKCVLKGQQGLTL